MGAWIETICQLPTRAKARSHPTWVRGLKLCLSSCRLLIMLSHPTWVRGLKLLKPREVCYQYLVAPYMGAWIETSLSKEFPIEWPCRTLHGCVD